MMMDTSNKYAAGEWLYVYVDYTYDDHEYGRCIGREVLNCTLGKWIYIYPGAEETYI